MELLDELYSGVPSLGSADIRVALETSYATAISVLFLWPGLVAMLVEPALFVLADRYPRRWFVVGGLLAMGVAAFVASVATSPWVLAGAIALAWVGSGCGVALAQATLVDARPDRREEVLARWAILGELGDLAAPALLAGLVGVGLGWREAYGLVGVAVSLWALALLTRPFPAAGRDADGEGVGLWQGVRAAAVNGRLLLWLGAGALCDLLDEVVAVFAVLYLRDDLGVGAYGRSVVLGASVLGAIAGALLTERLLARGVRPLRLLLGTSILAAALYVAWLLATEVWLSALLFFGVGMTVAPMYPIAAAQAYAALPGRSGTVNAAGHLFTPLVLAVPVALGQLADATTVQVALLALLAQPVGMAMIAAFARERGVRQR